MIRQVNVSCLSYPRLNIREGGYDCRLRGGGSSVFEPLLKGGSFNFQLPLRDGSSCLFFMGFGTHLTTKVTPFEQLRQVTHSDTNQALPAMDSCFCLIKPHQQGIADGKK